MRLRARVLLCALSVVFSLVSPKAATAQTDFSTVVVFGDSLSDTGNIAALTKGTFGIAYPSYNPLLGFNYTYGRFTDGKETQPPAQSYFGVWVEQLAASFPSKPPVTDSLEGGTNYAYGDATTGSGYTTISSGLLTLQVANMGQQVTNYLSQSPAPIGNAKTLYVLWGGANDIYGAVGYALANGLDPAAAAAVGANSAAANELALVQKLVAIGGTNFLIPNLPPLGSVPDYVGTPGSSAMTSGATLFASLLSSGLASLKTSYAAQGITVNFYSTDMFTLFSDIISTPMTYALSNVTGSAQGISGNPDTYLIWDGEHPTTTGHHFAAAAAANLFTPLVSSSVALTAPTAVLGSQTAALTAKVAGTGSATPTGLVTFFNGTTAVGSGALDATGSVTANFNAASSTTPYSLTAVYAGDTTYKMGASTAQPLTVLATAVSTTTTLNVGLLSTGSGQTADLTATVTPSVSTYGSVSGTVTFFDGTTNLGTGTLSNGTATLTTAALSVGTHSFTASYAASGIYAASTSTAVSTPVAGVGFTPSANPLTFFIKDGGTNTTQLSATPTGGYYGALNLSCGALPARMTCTFSSTTLTIPSSGATPSVTLTVGTTGSAALERLARPGTWSAPEVLSATLLFPGLAGTLLLGLRRRKGAAAALRLLCVTVVLLGGVMMGLSGCGNALDVNKGTYTVPVTFTPTASSVPAETVTLNITVN